MLRLKNKLKKRGFTSYISSVCLSIFLLLLSPRLLVGMLLVPSLCLLSLLLFVRLGGLTSCSCGRHILRGKIVRKDEGNLSALLQKFNFKEIIPSAKNVEEAKAYIKKLYGTTGGIFTAYQFTLL
jgi:hypothetical protein